MKYDEWKIDKEDLVIIIDMVENTIKSTLLRALGGGERDALREKERIVESHTQSDIPKQGIIGRLDGRFKF